MFFCWRLKETAFCLFLCRWLRYCACCKRADNTSLVRLGRTCHKKNRTALWTRNDQRISWMCFLFLSCRPLHWNPNGHHIHGWGKTLIVGLSYLSPWTVLNAHNAFEHVEMSLYKSNNTGLNTLTLTAFTHVLCLFAAVCISGRSTLRVIHTWCFICRHRCPSDISRINGGV